MTTPPPPTTPLTARPLTVTERAALLRRYDEGFALIEAALAGITETELDSRPTAEAWSPRMVVHHLADSESRSYQRIRRLIAEDTPAILGYDEGHWAEVLRYDRPIAASLAVVGAVRAATAEFIALLSEEEWQRPGTHSESGSYGAQDWLRVYVAHAEDHAAQIRAARGQ